MEGVPNTEGTPRITATDTEGKHSPFTSEQDAAVAAIEIGAAMPNMEGMQEAEIQAAFASYLESLTPMEAAQFAQQLEDAITLIRAAKDDAGMRQAWSASIRFFSASGVGAAIGLGILKAILPPFAMTIPVMTAPIAAAVAIGSRFTMLEIKNIDAEAEESLRKITSHLHELAAMAKERQELA